VLDTIDTLEEKKKVIHAAEAGTLLYGTESEVPSSVPVMLSEWISTYKLSVGLPVI